MFTLSSAQSTSYDLSTFGITITLTMPAGTYNNGDDAALIVSTLVDVLVHDAVTIQAVVPDTLSSFVNDTSPTADPAVVGWRAWSIPSQAELSADSRVPNSIWYPYTGDYVSIVPTLENVQEAANGTPLTLNDGTEIERYKTSWSDWTTLEAVNIHTTATSTGSLAITIPSVSSDRVSVYMNGVAQLTATYSIIGTTLTINTVTVGSEINVVIHEYTPTAAELAFDPSVAENLLIQEQYKIDYQYVEVPVRGEDGTITSTNYYFWVKNRSVASKNKSLSVKSITQLLGDGPSQYLTFQDLSAGAEPYYDAITIAGLNYIVTKDDTFKLRFTRDFTLRDNPNELDLKDVHTEWTLIRPGQLTKIPEDLWMKMVNTSAGSDPAGNLLPSPERASYDARNGTRTQFGFGADQVLAPQDLVNSTLQYTILNTKLVDESGPVPIPDYMTFLDFTQSDTWFSTPSNARNTLTRIWNEGKVSQINELFFAVLDDILASNYELTDLFKTSRLSAYSIKVVSSSPIVPTYE